MLLFLEHTLLQTRAARACSVRLQDVSLGFRKEVLLILLAIVVNLNI